VGGGECAGAGGGGADLGDMIWASERIRSLGRGG